MARGSGYRKPGVGRGKLGTADAKDKKNAAASRKTLEGVSVFGDTHTEPDPSRQDAAGLPMPASAGEGVDDGGLIRIEGTVEGVIYSNEENGYAVCDLESADGEMLTVTGTMPYISEGDAVAVIGKWIHNPKYGRQFKVEQYERSLPADRSSILRYLSSRTVKGIGPKLAARIVETFGEDAFDVIENHPEWLASEIKGLSMKVAMAASEDFREKSGMRSAMLFFRDYFGAALTVRIFKKWGNAAIDIAKRNPYRLCEEIDGIGFEKADAMAARLGIAKESPDRVKSGLVYLLLNNEMQNGHTCLPHDKLISAASRLLGCSEQVCRDAAGGMIKDERLVAAQRRGEVYIYTPDAYESESYIANKLTLLDRLCPAVDVGNIRQFIEKEEQRNGIGYAEMQKRAITDALENGVFILTGGPGTGKTTIVKALIDIFESMGLNVALAAPTGRAAKRMSEATSREAKTVHRMLEMEFGGEGDARFRRGEQDLLEENVVIIDEASMLDSRLTAALLRAVKPGARLLFIGDADQLPSVGAGNVLRDLIDSERFATVRLNEIFRQARMSAIVTNAHLINAGNMPELKLRDKDFFFLSRSADTSIAETIVDLCQNRLPRSYGEEIRAGIQVISPSRRGEAGTENLNIMLQSALNPPKPDRAEYMHRESIYRVGDRVMQIRNNYDLAWERKDSKGVGVFNGDIGVIRSINRASSSMEIEFDERQAVYDFSLIDDIEHAYAITVHKSQGSEYPMVVIPAFYAPVMLLTRNLLYTAVTRAQRMVIIVGREDVIGTMVSNNRTAMRYTGLTDMVNDLYVGGL